MSKNLVTLHPKDNVSRAREIFEKNTIHHIPITIMDELVGIVSQGDILKLDSKIHKVIKEYRNFYTIDSDTVDQYMTVKPFSIDKDKTLMEALNLMLEKRINALPVVNGDKLVGLITSFDLLNFLQRNLIA